MSAGTIIADNWAAAEVFVTVGIGGGDPPDVGDIDDLKDYEAGIQVEWDLTATATPGQADIIIDFGSGFTANPNSIAIINHNATRASGGGANITVTSGTSAAMASPSTLCNENLEVTEWETPYNFYCALDAGAAARRYFRIRITDATLQAAGTNLKIGQIVLGADALTYDNDITVYSAAGLARNYAYGWSRSTGPLGAQNTTVGGDTHQIAQAHMTIINGLQFNLVTESEARQLHHLITGRHGRDRVYQHNQQETLHNTAGLPIVFVPDVSKETCWYCYPEFTGLRVIEPNVSGTYDIGPFRLREQGR